MILCSSAGDTSKGGRLAAAAAAAVVMLVDARDAQGVGCAILLRKVALDIEASAPDILLQCYDQHTCNTRSRRHVILEKQQLNFWHAL